MSNPVVNYDGDNSSTDFAVPFPYLRESDVLVYVGAVLQTKGTDYTFLNATTIRFTTAPATGTANVQFARDTENANPIVDFEDSSDYTADNLDRAAAQNRYKLQEIKYTIDNLPTGVATGDVPAPTGANQFLVSDGTPEWTRQNVAGVLSTLGITGAVPTPDPGNKVIFTDASTSTYVLKTLAEAKTLLGVDLSAILDPSGINQGFVTTNTGGTDYQVLTQAQVKTLLGFGTAALKNVGTTVGTVPELVADGALPAVSGRNLTDINNNIGSTVRTEAAGLVLSADYTNAGDTALFLIVNKTFTGTNTFIDVSPDSDPANYVVVGDIGYSNCASSCSVFVPSGGMYRFRSSLPTFIVVQEFV